MKVLFLSDFFSHSFSGGAESNDENLINYLISEGLEVKKDSCMSVTPSDIRQYDQIIVSNFTHLSAECIAQLVKDKNFIIYEHDHKYVATRDPSKFSNFEIPRNLIINEDFYRAAKVVVVLSKICKDILEKNISGVNVHNIGCSLWSSKKLDFIESLLGREKKEKFAIVDSPNPIKGTEEAKRICAGKNIDYDLIKISDHETFLTSLASYEGLVFIPQVLETFSRISMEAKMLGCKLVTKKSLIGMCSEQKLFSLTGIDAIREIRNRNKKAFAFFKNSLLNNDKDKDITVILNCYRRPEYLKEQIDSIRNQTIKPKEIWVWVNHHEDNASFDFGSIGADKVIKNDHNWKFYGRFSAALLAQTKFVALFDDDTIPGSRWFENCLETYKTHPGILGGVGVLLKENRYYGHNRVGWSNPNESVQEVDLVGHAWFVERESIIDLWREEPFCWDNGEDIQLSYMAQKYSGTKTYVPPHPAGNLDMFSSTKGMSYGVDSKATSRPDNHQVFYNQRDECVRNATKNGWEPVYTRLS